jgi:mycothiol synthase
MEMQIDERPATVAVRPATVADLASIAALGHAAIDLGEHPDAGHADVERNLSALAAEPETAFVALGLGRVVGYLAPRLNELYVDADHRRRGLGTALVEATLQYVRHAMGHPYLLLFVPPGDSAGRRFAEARGFAQRATLTWMERPTDLPCPAPTVPADLVLRPFDPVRHRVADLVALMNATFADHPTPISWTEAAVRARMAAPDFDPTDTSIVATASEPDSWIAFGRAILAEGDAGPYGEVKLIGVLPAWRGQGLGRELLRWGITHLQERGAPKIALAVVASNVQALRMYEGHGFRAVAEWPQWSRDA